MATQDKTNDNNNPFLIRLPRRNKKEELTDEETNKELLKQRKIAMGRDDFDDYETDHHEEVEDDSDGDSEVHHITVKLQCPGDPDAPIARDRNPTILGACQSVFITGRTSLDDFLKLVQSKGSVELLEPKEDGKKLVNPWTYGIFSSGRGTTMKDLTALNLSLREADLIYKRWRDNLRSGDKNPIKGTIVVTGTRKPPAAKPKEKKQGGTNSPAMDPKTMDALLAIFSANHCSDLNCLSKSALHPACWPIVGTNPPRHLVLTNESAHKWAVALADGVPGVDEHHPPLVAPYVVTEDGFRIFKVKKETSNAAKKDPEQDKENIPPHSSQASSDGGIEFLGWAKPNDLPSGFLPRYGRHMKIDVFATEYDLSADVLTKLLNYDISKPSAAAEMTAEHMKNAGLSEGQQLGLKSALLQWREHGASGPELMQTPPTTSTSKKRKYTKRWGSGTGSVKKPRKPDEVHDVPGQVGDASGPSAPGPSKTAAA
ncbi:unnamed protein product [Tilletia caries]|nr:unnamed protein product [Tilletia caries]